MTKLNELLEEYGFVPEEEGSVYRTKGARQNEDITLAVYESGFSIFRTSEKDEDLLVLFTVNRYDEAAFRGILNAWTWKGGEDN